ncbi:unnamed protein product [Victoria cruziana]
MSREGICPLDFKTVRNVGRLRSAAHVSQGREGPFSIRLFPSLSFPDFPFFFLVGVPPFLSETHGSHLSFVPGSLVRSHNSNNGGGGRLARPISVQESFGLARKIVEVPNRIRSNRGYPYEGTASLPIFSKTSAHTDGYRWN